VVSREAVPPHIAQEQLFPKASSILKNIDDPQYSRHLEKLLLHLSNDWERVENLFVTILQSREQWLPHIVGLKNSKELRQKMEQALQEVSQENIEKTIALLSMPITPELRKPWERVAPALCAEALLPSTPRIRLFRTLSILSL